MEEAGAPSELSPGVCWGGLSLSGKGHPFPWRGYGGEQEGEGKAWEFGEEVRVPLPAGFSVLQEGGDGFIRLLRREGKELRKVEKVEGRPPA